MTVPRRAMVVAGLVSVSGSLMQRVMVVAGLVSVSGSLTQRVIKAEAARASARGISCAHIDCCGNVFTYGDPATYYE